MLLRILASRILNDVEHFQGAGGRDLCRLGARAFIDNATLMDRHQTFYSKTTIVMPTISGGGDCLTRDSNKGFNSRMSIAYNRGPIKLHAVILSPYLLSRKPRTKKKQV